jgi:hypothetical protein
MSMFYTPFEAEYLRLLALQRGYTMDLHHCSDGVLRTADDKAKFEADETERYRPRGGLLEPGS